MVKINWDEFRINFLNWNSTDENIYQQLIQVNISSELINSTLKLLNGINPKFYFDIKLLYFIRYLIRNN